VATQVLSWVKLQHFFMQKVLSFLKRSLSVAFLFAVLFNSVGASAADTYKGGLSDNQVKYNNYWNCNSSVPTKNYVPFAICKDTLNKSQYNIDLNYVCQVIYNGNNNWWAVWGGSGFTYWNGSGCYRR
jgi:hypothetical protein